MQSFAFGVHTTPPLLDSNVIMQRADDIDIVQRMLNDDETSAVLLVGNSGVGKSTVATLIYHRLLLTKESGMPAPHHLVWMQVNSYTTLSDLLVAMLSGIEVQQADLLLLTLEQQIALVLRALQRQQENALLVLDQFESLIYPETSQGAPTQRDLQLFLALLQADLGSSRILLTSSTVPFDEETMAQTRIRSYTVSRISVSEGVTLLQRRGIRGTSDELALVWQQCVGHVFALVLFSALVEISGIAPGYLLLAREYQWLWSDEIPPTLFALLYRYLTPIQHRVLRVLSLFSEPVSLEAITATMTGGNAPTPDSGQFYTNVGRELQTLIRLSLVQSLQDETLDAFFLLHPILRHYMQEHYLEETEQHSSDKYATEGRTAQYDASYEHSAARQEALAEGHVHAASYYYALAQQQVPSKERRTGIQDVEPLIAALRHLCLGRQWQQAYDLLFKEGLHESLLRWGAWNTLIGLYTALLPPFGILPLRDQGVLSSYLAMLYGRIGDIQQSQAYFEQALKIQRETQDTRGEAVTLANQGELYRRLGEREQAHINFEKAMVLSRRQPDQELQQEIHLQCIILNNMGSLYQDAKDHAPALSYYIQALHLTYKLQEQDDKGAILTNLGLLLCQQGQHREGVAVLLAALQLRKELSDPSVILLERFFIALEQRIGSNAYRQLCQAALSTQQEVLTHLMQVLA